MTSNPFLCVVVISAVLFLTGCSGGAPQKDVANPSDSLTSTGADTASSEDLAATGDDGSVKNYQVSDISTDANADCGGKSCEAGQQCITYTGFAGNLLYTCGIPCVADAPNSGCPDDMHCQVIADGPTQCVK